MSRVLRGLYQKIKEENKQVQVPHNRAMLFEGTDVFVKKLVRKL